MAFFFFLKKTRDFVCMQTWRDVLKLWESKNQTVDKSGNVFMPRPSRNRKRSRERQRKWRRGCGYVCWVPSPKCEIRFPGGAISRREIIDERLKILEGGAKRGRGSLVRNYKITCSNRLVPFYSDILRWKLRTFQMLWIFDIPTFENSYLTK